MPPITFNSLMLMSQQQMLMKTFQMYQIKAQTKSMKSRLNRFKRHIIAYSLSLHQVKVLFIADQIFSIKEIVLWQWKYLHILFKEMKIRTQLFQIKKVLKTTNWWTMKNNMDKNLSQKKVVKNRSSVNLIQAINPWNDRLVNVTLIY